jgi:hypothetical protein
VALAKSDRLKGATVKEQALDPGNRAALQTLASLAGVVGLSALVSGVVLSRNGPRHRDAGFATFEVFVVVAAVIAAIFTAFLCVLLLNRDEPIADSDLFRVSAPLLIAFVLLVLLTSVARFSTAMGDLSSNFPILLATVFAAVLVGLAPGLIAPKPGEIVLVAVGILAIGMLLGWGFLLFERSSLLGRRRDTRQRLEKLSADCFLPLEFSLTAMVPDIQGEPEAQRIVCWIQKDRLYLDQTEARRLSEAVDKSWASLANGNALPPLGKMMLVECALKTTVLPWPPKFSMIVTIHQRGKSSNKIHELKVGKRGLFDVTSLGLFAVSNPDGPNNATAT